LSPRPEQRNVSLLAGHNSAGKPVLETVPAMATDEPERVIAMLGETVRKLDVRPPSKVVASDPMTAETLYECSLA
jgi:hypothetical protein